MEFTVNLNIQHIINMHAKIYLDSFKTEILIINPLYIKIF